MKAAPRAKTDEAIMRGVFGVPTFCYGDELFWGDDATPLFGAFLNDEDMFTRQPYAGIDQVQASAERTVKKS